MVVDRRYRKSTIGQSVPRTLAVLAGVILGCTGSVGAWQVTPVDVQVTIRSLGNAGYYVRISGTNGVASTVQYAIPTSAVEWLVPGTLKMVGLVARELVTVEDSSYDQAQGTMTGTVTADGVYGVFGMSRAAHIARAQSTICRGLPRALAMGRGVNDVLPACRAFLCPEIDVAAACSLWSQALGRPVRPVEIHQFMQEACRQCSPEPLTPFDFPECDWLAGVGLGGPLQGELVSFPCPSCVRVCSDFDGDSVCDSYEICKGLSLHLEDSDGDGLGDGEELDLLTDPLNPDSDGDGLLDGWEVLGYDADGDGVREVDLSQFGVHPRRLDVFVVLDWTFVDTNNNLQLDTTETSFKPSAAVIDAAAEVFRNAPLQNVDGSTGVNLVVRVADEGIPEPEAIWNKVWDADARQFDQDFQDILKSSSPDPSLHQIARYSLWISQLDPYPNKSASGIAEAIPGTNFVVSLGFLREQDGIVQTLADSAGLSREDVREDAELATFLHELGHTLGLYHGGSGGDPDCGNCSRKFEPNYASVMNYFHQWPGLDGTFFWNADLERTDPTIRCADQKYCVDDLPVLLCFERNGTQRRWDFSEGRRPRGLPINEGLLREDTGLPFLPGLAGPVDWNRDDEVFPGAFRAQDLNADGCNDHILNDHDDWSAMVFKVW